MDLINSLKSLFRQKHEEQMAKIVKPTVLVCGYTGSGKTSLIQAICGKDTVPDEKIGHGSPMTGDFVPYRNDFVNFWDSKGFEPDDRDAAFVEKCQKLIADLQEDRNAQNHIHLVWYTIQGSGARVTQADIKLIRAIFSNVIVVITKNDITRPNQREAITAELVAKGVKENLIVPVSEEDPDSLRFLVDLTRRLLPEAYREAFESAQQIDFSRKRTKAQSIIHGAAMSAAAAASFNPLPISDAVIITPIQVSMIAALAVVYGLPVETMKVIAAPVVAQVAGVMTAASLAKVWPGMGMVIQGTVALALTEAIGHLVNLYMIKCCEARIKGLSVPAFDLPLDGIAQLLSSKQRTQSQPSEKA